METREALSLATEHSVAAIEASTAARQARRRGSLDVSHLCRKAEAAHFRASAAYLRLAGEYTLARAHDVCAAEAEAQAARILAPAA